MSPPEPGPPAPPGSAAGDASAGRTGTAAEPPVPAEAVLLWTHDIRSPLAAMLANLHHVRDVVASTEGDAAEVVGECLALCGLLERYVINLEILHRGRVGRGATGVRLRDVVADVVRRLAPHAVLTEHRLQIAFQGTDEPVVNADATLLRVALENLVASAMEQAPPGIILIEIARRDGEGVVTIVDDAAPWPPAGGHAFDLVGAAGRRRSAEERDGRGLALPAAESAASAAGARLVIDAVAGGVRRVALRAPLATGGVGDVRPADGSGATGGSR